VKSPSPALKIFEFLDFVKFRHLRGFSAFFHVGGETEKNALSKETHPCEKSGSPKQVPFRKIATKAESTRNKFPFFSILSPKNKRLFHFGAVFFFVGFFLVISSLLSLFWISDFGVFEKLLVFLVAVVGIVSFGVGAVLMLFTV
jgi:hypothetical protein